MRLLALSACALLSLIAARVAPVQSPSPATVVVLDSAAAVAEREQAIAALARLMPALDQRGASCVDWQRSGTSPLSRCAEEAYLRRLFPRPPEGVLSLREAAAIEGHNEAIRDAVIQRECARAPASSCGPRVHAAAIAALKNADADAQEKFEALRAFVDAKRPGRLILITSAVPFRSEPPALRKLIAAVRERGCELLVVRLSPVSPPAGILDDGVRTIERRVKFVRTIGVPDATDTEGTADALAGPMPAVEPAARAEAARPGEPRQRADAATSDDFARLHEYANRFGRQVRFIVARERYDQQVRDRAGSYGQTAGMVVAERSTDADYTYWAATRLWVPLEMTERYEQPNNRESSIIVATARYSDYRQFTVGTRIK